MIARIWRGVTSAEKAEQYFEYLMETGLKDYRTVPGNRGVQVLRRTYHETFRKTHWGNFQKRPLMAVSHKMLDGEENNKYTACKTGHKGDRNDDPITEQPNQPLVRVSRRHAFIDRQRR